MSTPPNSNSTGPVHWAIVLRPKKGKESDLESALVRFVKRSFDDPGVTGVELIRPGPDTPNGEFMLHRSFASQEDSRRFYDSDLFKQYQQETNELIDGDALIRPLHGFEAFFRARGQAPPRWKMALITWLAVFPAVVFWSALLSPHLHMLSPWGITAIVTFLVVITLTWGVMPLLTKALTPWLRANADEMYRKIPKH